MPRFSWPAALAFVLMAAGATAEPVRVFAAASLKTALDQIVAEYADEGGPPVTVSYAGSSVLVRQIQHGAPADIFVSANTQWMDVLTDAGLTARTRVLLANRLALIGPAAAAPVRVDPTLDLAGLLGKGRLAMALVEAVPAGIYGKQALQTLGLWDGVASQIAQADNVRAALRLVSAGAAQMGIVYATDAAADPRVRILGLFPPGSHDPILYPAALLMRAGPEAEAFWTYLTGPALPVFHENGFLPLEQAQ